MTVEEAIAHCEEATKHNTEAADWMKKFIEARAKLVAGIEAPKAHHEEAPGVITYEAVKDRHNLILLIEAFLQEVS